MRPKSTRKAPNNGHQWLPERIQVAITVVSPISRSGNRMPSTPHDHVDHTMSFGDHLEELRRRIILGAIVPLPLSFVTFAVSDKLIDMLTVPLTIALRDAGLPLKLTTLSPPELLVVRIKLSLIVALILSAPWIIWQIWQFIRPGLYVHERRFVNLLLPGSAVLTICGLLLMYFVMLPLMLRVLIGFGSGITTPTPPVEKPPAAVTPADPAIPVVTPFGDIPVVEADPADPVPGQAWILMPNRTLRVAVAIPDPEADADGDDEPSAARIEIFEWQATSKTLISQEYRLQWYVNFVMVLMLGVAIAFQMPLVVLLLGWLGLASAPWLRSKRRYSLLVCAVVAAMITPADAVSMLVMLVPLYALYEFGILLLVIAPASRVAEGRVLSLRKKPQPASPATPAPPAQTDRNDQDDDPSPPKSPSPPEPPESPSPPSPPAQSAPPDHPVPSAPPSGPSFTLRPVQDDSTVPRSTRPFQTDAPEAGESSHASQPSSPETSEPSEQADQPDDPARSADADQPASSTDSDEPDKPEPSS
jgi:Sec-independent protein secretion pathway component TatC